MRRLTMTIALLSLLFVGSVEAQTEETRLQRYRCGRPTTGGEPTSYIWTVKLEADGSKFFTATTPDTIAVLTVPVCKKHSVVVSAANEVGVGPETEPSAVDGLCAPGGCGRPVKY